MKPISIDFSRRGAEGIFRSSLLQTLSNNSLIVPHTLGTLTPNITRCITFIVYVNRCQVKVCIVYVGALTRGTNES